MLESPNSNIFKTYLRKATYDIAQIKRIYLIEALVTVALISILSSFAFSNYKEQMVWAN
jgi:hypothetical protein